jgi:predicted nucleotidyltransferase/HEPN domain-containing protein
MTDLSKILSHLPSDKIKELEIVTQRIIDIGGAEIVILFGSYARGDYKEQRGKDKGKKSDYDILVVTSNTDSQNELRSELREIFRDVGIAIQLIIENISYVNSNLEEKQYFFTDIKREGKILFNSGKHKLADSKELTPLRRREIAEDDFKMWFNMANDFYGQYKHAFSDYKYRIASFNLQQTIEMCYTAIEMVFAHYNPYEHNLDVLRKRALQFNQKLSNILPYETEEQKELFDYLNFAYIGGRYRSEEEFQVTKEQLTYWSGEAYKLLKLTENICKERIEDLKQIERKFK